MDYYDSQHVPNGSDDGARYTYEAQVGVGGGFGGAGGMLVGGGGGSCLWGGVMVHVLVDRQWLWLC